MHLFAGVVTLELDNMFVDKWTLDKVVSLGHKDDGRAYQQRRLDGDGVGLANPRQHEGYGP